MRNPSKLLALAGVAVAGAAAVPAQADINFSWDGFIRSETAFKATDRENPFNSTKGGNNFIGHPTCEPTAAGTTFCTNSAKLNPILASYGLAPLPGDPNLVRDNPGGGRSGQMANNVINMQMFRLELESQLKFNQNWSMQAKLHALVDPGWYDNYSPGQVHGSVENPSVFSPQAATIGATNFAAIDAASGGLSAQRANPGGIYGRPNYFKYASDSRFGVSKNFAQPMEWAGRNYQVYFPALFLEYNKGPFNARLGMQQIAWGQALFFRILDVPDGLDLRRHSALDLGAEEFSDKRVPAPALRVNYQINDNIVADAYFQKFQPSVLPNPGTPYNVITDRFSVHDNYGEYTSRGDYGIRLKGQFGDLSLQAIAVHQWNPAGVYHWEITGIHRGLTGLPDGGSAGPDLAKTAFFQDPTGTQSGLEWAQDAAFAHGNGATALDAAINDFPGAQALGAFAIVSGVTDTTPDGHGGFMNTCAALGFPGAKGHPESSDAYNCMTREVTTFTSSSGGLRGIVTREYQQEDVFGGGAGYVISAEPGSLLDQLIINVEAQYSPNRSFTAPDFGQTYVRKHEWTTALVMEKYQRFFINLPATYFVFQWEHKTQSDLFGRYTGSFQYYDKNVHALINAGGSMDGDVAKLGHGVGGGNDYFVFAFQQPFPNLIWRFDMSILGDKRGGILVQPAVRWKPNGDWTVNVFYNYLNGHLGSPQENIVSTVDWAKEVTIRIGYQF